MEHRARGGAVLPRGPGTRPSPRAPRFEALGLPSAVRPTPSMAGAVAAPAIVSSTGRKRRPAATARLTSTSCMPFHPGSASQSGSSIHSRTSCSRRKSSETHVTSAPDNRSRQGTPSFVALNVPESSRSTTSRIQVARSRTSTNCACRSCGAGARISPPRPSRCAQYVKRPLGSCGPTISPGRTIAHVRRTLVRPRSRRAP